MPPRCWSLWHFAIGSLLWGIAFAWLYRRLPLAWLVMMIMVMPLAGAGLFGLQIDLGAPVVTLVLHWEDGAMDAKRISSGVVTSHIHA